jgi:hypothetical protein
LGSNIRPRTHDKEEAVTTTALVEITAAPALDLAELARALENHGVATPAPISLHARDVLHLAIERPPADYMARIQRALDDVLERDQRPLVAHSVSSDRFVVRPPAG